MGAAMQIVIEGESAVILERLVALGHFPSPQAAVEDALRLADEEQQRRVAWMRARVQEALDEGGDFTMEEVERDLEQARLRYDKDHS